MASTNMTETLRLNQWIGTDKPKMADFNADNRKIDEAVGAHTGDRTIHITAEERAAWSRALPVCGSYTGDGASMREIEMGIVPRFGILFAIDKVWIGAISNSATVEVYTAFFTQQGCSQGMMITAGQTKFTVLNLAQAVYGRVAKLNETGVQYFYILFP